MKKHMILEHADSGLLSTYCFDDDIEYSVNPFKYH